MSAVSICVDNHRKNMKNYVKVRNIIRDLSSEFWKIFKCINSFPTLKHAAIPPRHLGALSDEYLPLLKELTIGNLYE